MAKPQNIRQTAAQQTTSEPETVPAQTPEPAPEPTPEPTDTRFPTAVKFALGDGAKFEGTGRQNGTTSIRVGVIYYALSDYMRVPMTVYKRVSGTTATMSLSLPKGAIELVGIDRNDLAQWLEDQTTAWVDWFITQGQQAPAAKATARGFSGIDVSKIPGLGV